MSRVLSQVFFIFEEDPAVLGRGQRVFFRNFFFSSSFFYVEPGVEDAVACVQYLRTALFGRPPLQLREMPRSLRRVSHSRD